MSTTGSTEDTMKVLVYSDDAGTRDKVRQALGRRPAADVPFVEIVECATEPKVHQWLGSGDIDVAVLDGETQPAGGMGVCRQAKDEVYNCPPVALIIARRDDRWLADWSKADAVIAQPLEPMTVADTVAELMRRRSSTRLNAK